MKKISIAGGVLLVGIAVVVFLLQMYPGVDSRVKNGTKQHVGSKNATDTIEGVPGTLVAGKADTTAVVATSELTDKKWQWIRTDYTDGRVFAPKKKEAFSLTFATEGTVAATTDCNGMSGSYTAVANSLVLGQMVMTMMYCEGSEEGVFSELLGQVSTYQFTGKGELELGLKADTGIMIFR